MTDHPVPVPAIPFFGRAGSGKGTLAEILRRDHGFATISTGQAMREWAVAGDSPDQLALRRTLAAGDHGSDALALRIIGETAAALPAGTPALILDGFPRSIAQLEAWLAGSLPASLAVLIDIDAATCRDRLVRRSYCAADGWTGRLVGEPCGRCGVATQQRGDDLEDAAVERRLAEYEERVEPILRRWVAEGRVLLVLDGLAAPESNVTRLLTALGS